MTFVNPFWLWGLGALIIPVAIHLLSRKEGKTVYIGSIRHLHDSDTAQFSSLRLNEILLLLLRILLIITLVMLLAGLQLKVNQSAGGKWAVIEKEIAVAPQYKGFMDSLQSQGFELRLFTKGFPLLNDSANTHDQSNYSSLAFDLGKASADTVVILSHNFLRNFSGSRFMLPGHIGWIKLDPSPTTFIGEAVQVSTDSLLLREGSSSTEAIEMSYRRVSGEVTRPARLRNPDTVRVSIVRDSKYQYDALVIRAVLQAIDQSLPDKVVIHETTDKTDTVGDLLFWLSDSDLPKLESPIVAMTQCKDENLPLLIAVTDFSICNLPPHAKWSFTRRLNEESALKGQLAIAVAKILGELLQPIEVPDNRSIDSELILASGTGESQSKTAGTGMEPQLIIALFLLLMIERFISLRRNQ